MEIPGFPGYTISEEGEVMNARGWILKTQTDRKGYVTIGLSKEGKQYTRKIHKLLAETWLVPGRADQTMVDHINGDKSDNRLENLRPVTNRENTWNRSLNGNKNNALGHLDIAEDKWGFHVTIRRNGVRVFRKQTQSLEEAIAARDMFLSTE